MIIRDLGGVVSHFRLGNMVSHFRPERRIRALARATGLEESRDPPADLRSRPQFRRVEL